MRRHPGFWFAVLGIPFGLCVMIAFVADTIEETSKLLGLQSGEGMVMDRRTEAHDDDNDMVDYYITFRFDVNFGDPPDLQRFEQEVSQPFYDTNPIESRIEVRYNPDDPTEVYINTDYLFQSELTDAFFGIGCFSAFLIVGIGGLIAARRGH